MLALWFAQYLIDTFFPDVTLIGLGAFYGMGLVSALATQVSRGVSPGPLKAKDRARSANSGRIQAAIWCQPSCRAGGEPSCEVHFTDIWSGYLPGRFGARAMVWSVVEKPRR